MEGRNVLASLLLASFTQDWNQMKEECRDNFLGMYSQLYLVFEDCMFIVFSSDV
jgi:hypothetical protein